MSNTPQKISNNSTRQNTILKVAIQQKLAQKNGLFTFQQKLQQKQQSQQIDSFQIKQDELKLLETIELYQSKTEIGYFRYDDWKKFNASQFGYVREEIICNFWKILRIINHGEVIIPTGLIYEVSYYFIIKNQSTADHSTSLKQVINQFLRMNQTNQFVNNFRELSNYPSLQDIQSQYCPLFFKNRKQSIPKHKEKHNIGALCDRLHKEHKKRDQSIRQLKYASLAKEISQCKFKPNITNYTSKTQLKRCDRMCKHQHLKPSQEQVQFFPKFVAGKIDKKIYEGKIAEIPGAMKHIKRAQFSQAERQRIKRLSNRLKIR